MRKPRLKAPTRCLKFVETSHEPEAPLARVRLSASSSVAARDRGFILRVMAREQLRRRHEFRRGRLISWVHLHGAAEACGLRSGFVRLQLLWMLVLPCLLFVGCKTSSIESRKRERSAAYARLPPEFRADVDAGRIRVGMDSDAVYTAWGKPAQVLESETDRGHVTTWLYEGGWMQEERYWSYRTIGVGKGAYAERYLAHDYYPRAYIRAEVNFVNGRVKEWRTLPRPTY